VVLRNKGEHARSVLTVGGEIDLRRRYFWSAGKGGVYPVDESAGIEQSSVSPGAREVLCRMGVIEDFARAAEDAKRIGNVPASKERLRQIVEGEAQRVREVRESGKLLANWSVSDAKVDGNGPSRITRIYEGTDGVMVPTVTQEEKDKRRKQQIARRQQRVRAGLENTKELPAARPGSDERFKEMKIGVFYDQEKKHRHAFATEQNHEAYGPLLKIFAQQIGFDEAQESLSLVDGAKWIATQVCWALAFLKVLLLDFYHLSQHVYQTATCCLGETEAARQWAQARLKEIKELGLSPVLAAIDALNKKTRAKAKKKSLQKLRDYLVERREMLDYRTALARGWDIGSGPTEAMCKTLTLRLKRPGMKWDRDHAAAMMNLEAMYESGQSRTYWNSLRAAA
jgi:hypothetical protein